MAEGFDKKLLEQACWDVAVALRQEYRFENGAWWLYSLGKARRPLSDDEVAFHQREHGWLYDPAVVYKPKPRC